MTDPDLFTPSLDASHDTDGIDRPWSPTALLFITFFCGITAGGVLIALNYKRFGLASRIVPTLLVAVAVTVALSFGSAWYSDRELSPPRGPERVGDERVSSDADPIASRPSKADVSQRIRFGRRAISLIVAGILIRAQFRRQRLVELHDLKKGSLWLLGTAVIVVGLLADWAFQVLVTALYRNV